MHLDVVKLDDANLKSTQMPNVSKLEIKLCYLELCNLKVHISLGFRWVCATFHLLIETYPILNHIWNYIVLVIC